MTMALPPFVAWPAGRDPGRAPRQLPERLHLAPAARGEHRPARLPLPELPEPRSVRWTTSRSCPTCPGRAGAGPAAWPSPGATRWSRRSPSRWAPWSCGSSARPGRPLRAFLLCLAMVATAFTDLETRRIPDRITLPAVIGACVLAPEGLGRGSVGALIGAVLLAARRDGPRRGTLRPAPPSRGRRSRSRGASPARRLLGGGVGRAGRAAARGRESRGADGAGVAAHLPRPRPGRPRGRRAASSPGAFFLVAWVSHAALGRTGLGGGDIKLAGLIGAALGAERRAGRGVRGDHARGRGRPPPCSSRAAGTLVSTCPSGRSWPSGASWRPSGAAPIMEWYLG